MKDKLCNVCYYVTNKTSNLKKHMKVHDKQKQEPVGSLHCPTCQKSFEIKEYLTAHMKTHFPKDNSNKEEMKEKINVLLALLKQFQITSCRGK